MYHNKLYDKTVNVYDSLDIRPILEPILQSAETHKAGKNKTPYVDIFATFDIETTVVENEGPERREGGKYSHFNYTWHWQLCIAGYLATGRYVEDYFELADWISAKLGKKRMLCFIHNLAYEYNNLAEYFVERALRPDKDLFFRTKTHPLKIVNGNIEYRCTFQLTHKSLDTLSKEIGLEKGQDFDYDIPRHSQTYISPEEIEYCLRDVYNLYKWVESEIVRYCKSIKKPPHICRLPLTQTGYVRYDVRHNWSNTKSGQWYLKRMAMTPAQYELCRDAFRGGDTHANYRYLCKVIENVRHRDFCSAYPSVLVFESFPAGPWHEIGHSDLNRVLRLVQDGRHCIATYDIKNLDLKPFSTSYIASSKCNYISPDAIVENGRVMRASRILLTVTDVDLPIIFSTYDCDPDVEVGNLMWCRSKPLPDEIIKTILKYFCGKTIFKGDPTMYDEYCLSKQKLNGIYGCSASRNDRPKISVDLDTLITEEFPGEYEPSTVMPYQWAPFVTAFVRRNLYLMKRALERSNGSGDTVGSDFIYCDTDAAFYMINDDFEKFVERYNNETRQKSYDLARRLGIPLDDVAPVAPNGQRQFLGLFTADDDYEIDRFITVGAKRYVTQQGEQINMTFSGLSHTKYNSKKKEMGHNANYIADKYGNGDVFKAFERFPEQDVVVPYEPKYGKLSNYIERGEFCGIINDGSTEEYVTAKSSMVLTPVDMSLTLERSLYTLFFSESLIAERW